MQRWPLGQSKVVGHILHGDRESSLMGWGRVQECLSAATFGFPDFSGVLIGGMRPFFLSRTLFGHFPGCS
jgi:hypothetical protein